MRVSWGGSLLPLCRTGGASCPWAGEAGLGREASGLLLASAAEAESLPICAFSKRPRVLLLPGAVGAWGTLVTEPDLPAGETDTTVRTRHATAVTRTGGRQLGSEGRPASQVQRPCWGWSVGGFPPAALPCHCGPCLQAGRGVRVSVMLGFQSPAHSRPPRHLPGCRCGGTCCEGGDAGEGAWVALGPLGIPSRWAQPWFWVTFTGALWSQRVPAMGAGSVVLASACVGQDLPWHVPSLPHRHCSWSPGPWGLEGAGPCPSLSQCPAA